jgi:hypothetical protein
MLLDRNQSGLFSPLTLNTTPNGLSSPIRGQDDHIKTHDAPRAPHPLTDKTPATPTRILEHAADPIHTHGIHATNNELEQKQQKPATHS